MTPRNECTSTIRPGRVEVAGLPAGASQAPVCEVVKQHLCHGCGTCVAVCPAGAIQMAETAAGFLVPQVNSSCTSCGLCGVACPGARFAPRLLDEDCDPFKGEVLNAYLVRATDPGYFRNGQSGGAVSALLDHMLSCGTCDGALVTGPVDRSMRPRPFVARSREDLLWAQSSKYCPVALNAALRTESFRRLKHPAIVALPCHVHGVRSLERMHHGSLGARAIVLGLVCAGTYSFHLLDHLRQIARRACPQDDFQGLRFRDKLASGWPGDVSIYSKSRSPIRLPARQRTCAKSAYISPRCYLCFDRMNVLSDVTFGDPWRLRSDPGGWTVVLTRTDVGQRAFDEALSAGALSAEPVEPESVFAGQKVDRHRAKWALSCAAWRQMGFVAPDVSFNDSCRGQADSREAKSRRRQLSYSLRFWNAKDSVQAVRMAKWHVRRVTTSRLFSVSSRMVWSAFARIRKLYRLCARYR